jgi:transposase
LPLGYVLEATGVYYEELAYYLHTQQQTLSVLQPSEAKHFAQSTERKSKTDLLDARLLCRLGLELCLPPWQPLTPAMRLVRSLTRERAGLRQQLVPLKNRVHAYAHSYQPDSRALASSSNWPSWRPRLRKSMSSWPGLSVKHQS